ncbi:helix-turn-helix domain-containing protein [Pelotomaculum sp. PtaB.Bin117]|uniref:helix-turn-helix domain-containing protein n=1 Tax=Pelotomaculum sp. PtaB.Bin117 TaxID=1811694 RepID=UPI0009CC04CE|nr:helix-turn-helix domain-containing protein [Pelotomaculum sp. PtaB.Bin117]OPX85731.1 MAG: Helix-turn-helix domain protein [Pelotomaculum sp. PtaB.Bin117]
MLQQKEPDLGDKLTVEEVSRDYFGGKISAYTVRDLWRRGQLPGVKCGGRLIFSRSELTRWFTEQSRANVERQESEHGKLRVITRLAGRA